MFLNTSSDVMSWAGLATPFVLGIIGAEAAWRRRVSKRLDKIEQEQPLVQQQLSEIKSDLECTATQNELRMVKDHLAGMVNQMHSDIKDRLDDISRRVP